MDGFAYLGTLPLSNAEIGREVGQAAQAWAGIQAALPQAGTASTKQLLSLRRNTGRRKTYPLRNQF